MPNNCYNTLEINGPLDILLNFLEKGKSINEDNMMIELDFDKFYPTPNEEDWYDWRIANWGTKWNAYDINFRAARFKNGVLTEKALVTVYFNGKKVHVNWPIQQVWGGPNSGIDGGNNMGKGITDVPGGLKLQAEGHDVLYKNIWIERLDIKKPNTDF